MKTGKQITIEIFDNFRTRYGSVDTKNLKSIYVVLSTWAQPKEELEKWDRVVGLMRKNIKYSLATKLSNPPFKKQNMIVDLDIRTSGICKEKRSFLNCEMTLYTNTDLLLKSPEMKTAVKDIITDTVNKNFKNHQHFNFYKSKI
tara:strand:- start:2400 stop:2831 length:432 start_codon:yes stop_codon:yes gene_type:complete